MSAAEPYGASPVNERPRATGEEMEERARFLIKYSDQHGPVTVRGLYYRAEVARLPLIDKTETSYRKVQRQVVLLRRAVGSPTATSPTCRAGCASRPPRRC
jgi:hypothetical protein